MRVNKAFAIAAPAIIGSALWISAQSNDTHHENTHNDKNTPINTAAASPAHTSPFSKIEPKTEPIAKIERDPVAVLLEEVLSRAVLPSSDNNQDDITSSSTIESLTYAEKIDTLELNFATSPQEEKELRGCIASTFEDNADKVSVFNSTVRLDLELKDLVFDERLLSLAEDSGLIFDTIVYFNHQYMEEEAFFATDVFIHLGVHGDDNSYKGDLSHSFHTFLDEGDIAGVYAPPSIHTENPDYDMLSMIENETSEYYKIRLEQIVKRFSKCHFNQDLATLNKSIDDMYTPKP